MNSVRSIILLHFSVALLLGAGFASSASASEAPEGVFRVDLKSFLHGAPPKPLPPDATAAAVSYAPGVAPDKEIFDFMLAFAEAVRKHDGTALKARLSERYTIENMMGDTPPADLFLQAIGQMKSPNEIIITALEKEGDLRVARMDFQTEGRPVKHRTFKFDRAGKLLSADFFSLKMRVT